MISVITLHNESLYDIIVVLSWKAYYESFEKMVTRCIVPQMLNLEVEGSIVITEVDLRAHVPIRFHTVSAGKTFLSKTLE